LRFTVLHEQHAGHQDPSIAHEQATGLKDQPAIEIARRPFDNFGIGLGVWRRLVVVAIWHPQTAAHIAMRALVTATAQVPGKFRKERVSISEGVEFDDLSGDVHINDGNLETLQLGGPRINLAGATDRNAELVLCLSGCNLVMRLGIDVRIDADRYSRAASLRRRN